MGTRATTDSDVSQPTKVTPSTTGVTLGAASFRSLHPNRFTVGWRSATAAQACRQTAASLAWQSGCQDAHEDHGGAAHNHHCRVEAPHGILLPASRSCQTAAACAQCRLLLDANSGQEACSVCCC